MSRFEDAWKQSLAATQTVTTRIEQVRLLGQRDHARKREDQLRRSIVNRHSQQSLRAEAAAPDRDTQSWDENYYSFRAFCAFLWRFILARTRVDVPVAL